MLIVEIKIDETKPYRLDRKGNSGGILIYWRYP